MRELGIKILRRSLPVAFVLGLMGYVFAEIFLMMHRMNGGVPDPANNSVRWRTPLTMAGIGVFLQAIIEFLLYAIRRKRPAIEKPSEAAAAPKVD
jgi:hypothetical protein